MYILIVNNVPGNGKALELLRLLEKNPFYKKYNCRSFLADSPGHAEKVASQTAAIQSGNLQGIIVVGGESTLHNVINGLVLYPDLPLGFLPTGNGSDFAKAVRLRNDNEKLFEHILTRLRPISYWTGTYLTGNRSEKHKRSFISSVSFGLDVEIENNYKKINKEKKLVKFRPGFLAYMIALLRTLRLFTPFAFKLSLDEQEIDIENGWMVVVSNHPYFSGGIKINPHAGRGSAEDFCVLVLHGLPRWKIFIFFILLFFGKHSVLKEVDIYQAATVSVHTKTSVPFLVDGQINTCSSCHIRKDKRARKIFIGSAH